MANTQENRINTTIADANMTALIAAITAANSALSGSTASLTEDERIALFSLEVANKEFVADCLAQGNLLNAQLPAALQTIVTNLGKDVTLNQQCETIINTLILPLLQLVADTKRLSGHEGYVGALAIYKVIEAMAEMGIPGFQAAYDVLKKRFAGQGGSTPAPTP